jgi:Kef-type K+ transport system membrane component KefB
MSSVLPQLPLSAGPLALFGLLLLAGVIGGELARRFLRLPRIVGQVLIGMLLGASGLRLLDADMLDEAWIFVEIALGLVLFELGLRLDFTWLRRDRWLLATGLIESALSFAFMYYALTFFGVESLYAAVAAAVGVSTSPAVVMLVAQELRAEGQVTERALNLVAINSVVAFLLVTMLLSWIHHEYLAGWQVAVLHPVYMLGGSLLLGYSAFIIALALSRWFGKSVERHFVVVLGLIIATIGVARMLEVSPLIALLAFGVFARNFDERHDLMAVDMSAVGQLFFVVLFVVEGASLQPAAFASAAVVAIVYILARFAGKSLGVMTLARFSGVRAGSAGILCLTLTPMSGLALAMLHGTAGLYPEFTAKLSFIVVSAALILELIGPLAVQFALRHAGEAHHEGEKWS